MTTSFDLTGLRYDELRDLRHKLAFIDHFASIAQVCNLAHVPGIRVDGEGFPRRADVFEVLGAVPTDVLFVAIDHLDYLFGVLVAEALSAPDVATFRRSMAVRLGDAVREGRYPVTEELLARRAVRGVVESSGLPADEAGGVGSGDARREARRPVRHLVIHPLEVPEARDETQDELVVGPQDVGQFGGVDRNLSGRGA